MDSRDDALAPLDFRRANVDDVRAIVDVGRRALGWSSTKDEIAHFTWKHLENPFGASPMWVALDAGRVVGVRAFLQWRFRAADGGLILAARAVDTATHPEYQRRGVFTRLTEGALDALAADGVQMIFNTPNARSLRGYLRLGWSKVGRLPVSVMLGRRRVAWRIATARGPASRSSIDTGVGEAAAEVLADEEAVSALLASQPRPTRLVTDLSPAFLAWRYGHAASHYRVVLHGKSVSDGFAAFHLRRRGHAVEAAVCDVLTPGADPGATRSLLASVAQRSGASYLLRLDGRFPSRRAVIRVPRAGPVLTCRRLDGAPAPARRDWGLVLGDVEAL